MTPRDVARQRHPHVELGRGVDVLGVARAIRAVDHAATRERRSDRHRWEVASQVVRSANVAEDLRSDLDDVAARAAAGRGLPFHTADRAGHARSHPEAVGECDGVGRQREAARRDVVVIAKLVEAEVLRERDRREARRGCCAGLLLREEYLRGDGAVSRIEQADGDAMSVDALLDDELGRRDTRGPETGDGLHAGGDRGDSGSGQDHDGATLLLDRGDKRRCTAEGHDGLGMRQSRDGLHLPDGCVELRGPLQVAGVLRDDEDAHSVPPRAHVALARSLPAS